MGRVRPTLVVNRHDGGVFEEYAETVVAHGVGLMADLEMRLRTVYPNGTVHARELGGELLTVWYVYRDGHWVASEPGPSDSGVRDKDAEPTRRSSVHRGVDRARRRARQSPRGR